MPVNAVSLHLVPSPSRILHEFDWVHGIVLNTFDYDSDTIPSGSAFELQFQTRDEFTGTAWRLEQPVTVAQGTCIERHGRVAITPVDPATVRIGGQTHILIEDTVRL